MRKTLLLLGLVYLLGFRGIHLEPHHADSSIRRADPRQFDTWFACEQARMEIERKTDWRGRCYVPKPDNLRREKHDYGER